MSIPANLTDRYDRLPAEAGQSEALIRPPATINYVHSPGFAAMHDARISPEFYQLLRPMVPDAADGMWYASTQSYGNRLEATALAVGADRLLAVNAVQPMRRVGLTADGRPQLRRAGPWAIDYVTIPFTAGTCHVSRLAPRPNTRHVPIHPQLRKTLTGWLDERPDWPGANDHPALFLNQRGRRLSVRGAHDIICGIAADAGLEDDTTTHVLRHSFATTLVRGGTDLVIVAELLGHARLVTTRAYTRPTAEDRARALDLLPIDQ